MNSRYELLGKNHEIWIVETWLVSSKQMQEDQLRRVREYLDDYEIREREQRLALRHEVRTIAERDAPISAAVRSAILGSIPSIVWSIFASIRSSWPPGFAVLFAPLYFVVPFVIIAAAAGVVGGLFAH